MPFKTMSMKIIHIESGLGNQMLSYCELLAIKKMNPTDDFFVETIVYDLPECHETICQWNGYELEKVFGITEKNISEVFSSDEWSKVMGTIRDSRFWEKNWNYPPYFKAALECDKIPELIDLHPNREYAENLGTFQKGLMGKLREWMLDKTWIGSTFKRVVKNYFLDIEKKYRHYQDKLFFITGRNVFAGQMLAFKYVGTGIERIHEEVLKAFTFPAFSTKKNREFAAFLDANNAVFIHARRGDMLSANGWCYKYGYFRRAVKYIKKHVENPVFVFFTNPGSVEWCMENARTFALDYSKDKVYFVDWNSGDESYRDMQLMSHCKHGIITNSTFGWWGAYFIQNPNKITISPMAEINTTYHC